MPSRQTIVIVGAGFSGTATLVNLLLRPPVAPTRIVLVERGPEPGRGLAYARGDFPYRLNVPAARMSLHAADPDGFLRYAQRHVPGAAPGDCLPRALYGSYLEAELAEAQALAPEHVVVEVLRDEVRGLRQHAVAPTFEVALSGGTTLRADAVVLAPGNPPPRDPGLGVATAPGATPAGDPAAGAGPHGALFVIGAGLTMVDAVCRARAGDPDRPIHVLSRHGLLPRAQHVDAGLAADDAQLAAALCGTHSVRGLVRAVRSAVARVQAAGGHWQAVVMQVRHDAAGIWARLDLAERRRFLRHVRAYWDVHRHRTPVDVAADLAAGVASRRVIVHAGRLRGLCRVGQAFEVRWAPRGGGSTCSTLASQVINCSGPDTIRAHWATRCGNRCWPRG